MASLLAGRTVVTACPSSSIRPRLAPRPSLDPPAIGARRERRGTLLMDESSACRSENVPTCALPFTS